MFVFIFFVLLASHKLFILLLHLWNLYEASYDSSTTLYIYVWYPAAKKLNYQLSYCMVLVCFTQWLGGIWDLFLVFGSLRLVGFCEIDVWTHFNEFCK